MKLTFSPSRFAQQHGYGIANIPLKDGSTVKILDNMNGRVNVFQMKKGRVLGAQGYSSPDVLDANEYIFNTIEKIRPLAEDAQNLTAKVLKQLIDSLH